MTLPKWVPWLGWVLLAGVLVAAYALTMGAAGGLLDLIEKLRPKGKNDATTAGAAARAAAAVDLAGRTDGDVLSAAGVASGTDIAGAVGGVADRAVADMSRRGDSSRDDGARAGDAAHDAISGTADAARERLRRAATGGNGGIGG